MIHGIGVDICSVTRLQESLSRTPKLGQRLFTETELETRPESLAARFAAKEALAKAIGDPRLLSWQEVEIVSTDLGKPLRLFPTILASQKLGFLAKARRLSRH